MRVAMISENASPLVLGSVDAGGQNLHVARVSAALAGLGHDVRVYVRRSDQHSPDLVTTADGYCVAHVPAGPATHVSRDAVLAHVRPLGRWLTQQWSGDTWAPDVIHAHFWMSGLAALVATGGMTYSPPVIQTFHALGIVRRRHHGKQDTSPPDRIGLERVLVSQVNRIIALCRDEQAELLRLGTLRRQIALVPSGVDTETFCPTGPAIPRSTSRPRLLTVGRLVERKGHVELIQALRRVPDAELVIVGGPPAGELTSDAQARRLRQVALEVGVSDRVMLVGAIPHDQMPAWYRSADVVVCTPWYEPFGLTALEAMACGTPVVATAVGGLTDTVVDGVTGDLIPPRDQRVLGDAIRRLLADLPRRLCYASAGADRARTCYPWARTAAQVEAVYQQVCAAAESDPGESDPGESDPGEPDPWSGPPAKAAA